MSFLLFIYLMLFYSQLEDFYPCSPCVESDWRRWLLLDKGIFDHFSGLHYFMSQVTRSDELK